MTEPAPGRCRIGDGPWMSCAFTFEGPQRGNRARWQVVAEDGWTRDWSDLPKPGRASVDIVLAAGVIVTGEVFIDSISRGFGWGGTQISMLGEGPLRLVDARPPRRAVVWAGGAAEHLARVRQALRRALALAGASRRVR